MSEVISSHGSTRYHVAQSHSLDREAFLIYNAFMNKMAAILFGCYVSVSGLLAAPASNEVQVVPAAADPKVYGQYPIAYKEIITRWLGTKLVDPASGCGRSRRRRAEGRGCGEGSEMKVKKIGFVGINKLKTKNEESAS